MSYADILKELKTKASPDEVGSKVGKIRKTRDGILVIELRKDSKLEEVSGAIRKAVRDELLVRPLVPTVTIELRDLEETTNRRRDQRSFYHCPSRGDSRSSRSEGSPRRTKRNQSGTRSGTKSHSDCKGAKARQS